MRWVKNKLVLLTLLSHTALANDVQTPGTLSKIRDSINQLRQHIASTKQQHTGTQQQLSKLDQTISELRKKIQQTKGAIAEQTQRLKELESEQRSLEQQRDAEKGNLIQLLRMSYSLSYKNQLDLLNWQDAQEIQRFLHYYRYLNTSAQQAIEKYQTLLSTLAERQQAILQKKQELEALQTKQQSDQAQLLEQQNQHKKLLQNLSSTLHNDNQQLDKLVADQKNLERLLQNLQRAEASQPSMSFPSMGPFSKWQGKLPWPTKGKIIKTFGSPIENSGLKYSGVFLQTSMDENVYSIYSGRIVFANWMQGFGLLVIVDHGGGYMSLYGQNHSLYKKANDIVKAGELIAKTGNQGRENQPGLYFEIRHNGHPVNPQRWCK